METTEVSQKTTTTNRTYWGKMSSLYPYGTLRAIDMAEIEISPLTLKFSDATNQLHTAKYRIQGMGQELKQIIETGVYTAFDLDEIVASQKVAGGLIQKMIVEVTYVQTAIASNMSGKAAKALEGQLQSLLRRLEYYGQLVDDCFGDQPQKSKKKSSVLSKLKGKRKPSKSFRLD